MNPVCELCDRTGGELLWQGERCRAVYVEEAGYPGFCRVIWQSHVKEMTDLSEDEATEFLKELGVSESGVGALIRATYHLLGLRTYFTAGEKEVRAWTIHAGDTAPKAAGVIHTDFERGFIKAETVAYTDLVACGSVAAARDKGLYRMEGKEYVVQDGDVLVFKFNV